MLKLFSQSFLLSNYFFWGARKNKFSSTFHFIIYNLAPSSSPINWQALYLTESLRHYYFYSFPRNTRNKYFYTTANHKNQMRSSDYTRQTQNCVNILKKILSLLNLFVVWRRVLRWRATEIVCYKIRATLKRWKCLAPYHLIEMFITQDFPSLRSRLLIPSFHVSCLWLYSIILAIHSKLSEDFRSDSLK